jgi:hypothetical protein
LEAGSAIKVTWTMQGSNLYVMKVMSIFVNMDRVMGKHFENCSAILRKQLKIGRDRPVSMLTGAVG